MNEQELDALAMELIRPQLEAWLRELQQEKEHEREGARMNFIALPPFQLCSCGWAIGVVPVPGGYACESCNALHEAQNDVPRASTDLRDPRPSLDELLDQLTGAV